MILFLYFIKDFFKNNKKAAAFLTTGSLFWAFTYPVAPYLLGSITDSLKAIQALTLKNSQISEMGTHQELLKKKGIFHTLWKRQADGFF